MTERSQPAQLPSKESHFKALAKEFIKADEQQNGSLPVNLQIAINQFARWLDERSSHETCELQQLRRIDKAARAFVDARPGKNASKAYAALIDALFDGRPTLKANSCVCGEPNSPGTHRTDGPCLAPIGDHHP